jgi:hypothetical protein
MRTTITLDDDVAALIRKFERQRKASFKQIVNSALRDGLGRMDARRPKGRPFRTQALDLGECLVGSVDDVSELLEVAEGDDHR